VVDIFEARAFRKGQVIIREGESGDCAFLIESGRVEIFKMINGKRSVLATLQEGAIFGEMALVDAEKRSAFAEAVVPTTALVIDRRVLETAIGQSHPVVRALLHAYIRHLRVLGAKTVA
jgi:CRP-like cAMP-binding protein